MMNMDTRKPVRNLAESIRSLLGLKANLTSSWADSVCDIIKSLPSEEPRTDRIKPANSETTNSFDDKEVNSGTIILKLKDELAALTAYINQLNIQRRQVLNEFLDLKGNIRVFCRIRPITVGENSSRLSTVITLDSSNALLKLAENKSKRYSFDKVFHPGSSQDEVFLEVEPVIKTALDGYNACIFAYGQTGTGKTYTMEGTPDGPGVVPRAMEVLFKQAVDSNNAFLFSFSMLEIYLGNLKDLLVPQSTKVTDPLPPSLSVQTDPKGGIEIDNLVSIQVSDFNQALSLYRLGRRFRSTASTNSNIASSRSHCMIRITMTCSDAPERRRETNKIWMVDLGGSERVLKTKASGRRLEEGKAINLSLSALGDVINALQRKKSHIPYRNSKLTQVLKDSLGEDSKTLMLVHVSPKEEDLCETVCSLNFATRVRSIHLVSEESTEIRDQKELAMTNLQQKIEWIEDERPNIRRQIDKLNERLENLTRTISSSNEQLEASHPSMEEPQSKVEIISNRTGDVTAAPIPRIPRFMRPTICSRRKSGIDHENSEKKGPAPAKRRKAFSRHAESVSFPVKGISEYSSDHSISRTSCLAGLNLKCSADNETEYSQDTSECDVKMVVFPEWENSLRSSIRKKAHFSHTEECGNRKTDKLDSTKFSKVDNWLHLHKNEPTIRSYMHRSKQVLAIPTPEKKNECNGQNISEKLQDDKVHNQEHAINTIADHQIEKLTGGGVAGTFISEVAIDKTVSELKDFISKNPIPNSVYPSHTTDGTNMIQTQGLVDGPLIEEDKTGPFPPPEVLCVRFIQNMDNRMKGIPINQEITGKTQCSDTFMLNNSNCCHFYPPDMDNGSIDLIEDSDVSTSISEPKSHCPQVPSNSVEDAEKESLCVSSQQLEIGTRSCLHRFRSQRALFMDTAKPKDLTMFFDESQGNMGTGICDLLKQKIRIFYASALLGLGFENLGFEHEFFYGLML
ncbi:hypothetical protein PVL29_006987 [Vitis rotundifolia]|uniref:Kinesin motor domain-containing protein n=1 Tax=Vitis rotundifolia TaxID=103349 RepID=A0AA39DVH7_VITRO|nr:hypothetical protein PVL29_006987 [Vitis rotundifolia]